MITQLWVGFSTYKVDHNEDGDDTSVMAVLFSASSQKQAVKEKKNSAFSTAANKAVPVVYSHCWICHRPLLLPHRVSGLVGTHCSTV